MMSVLDGTKAKVIKLIQRSKYIEIQSTRYISINARGDCQFKLLFNSLINIDYFVCRFQVYFEVSR